MSKIDEKEKRRNFLKKQFEKNDLQIYLNLKFDFEKDILDKQRLLLFKKLKLKLKNEGRIK